ncbi:metallo-beta-lactamase precursor [alpha proteobacterium U9-1i]|nr:metallo-beta-lactamase precursor [alpha proteobacterium U9-1i]
MARTLFACLVLTVGLAACAPSMAARTYSFVMQDNIRRAPFEMAPGLFYVGASDIAVFAIETADGLVLIDGGYAETAPQVVANLRTLGFEPSDVRLLLNTHAHFDHAAGLRALKDATGAELYASPLDARLLEGGGSGDFFFGGAFTYDAVDVDRRLRDGEAISHGGVNFTPHFTPGHTQGCTSWSFPVQVDGQTRQALVICSLSRLLYPLVDNERYPHIASDFRGSFATLRGLRCDVFLGTHGNFFNLSGKRRRMRAGAPNPFVDPAGCAAFIDRAGRRFERALARQLR